MTATIADDQHDRSGILGWMTLSACGGERAHRRQHLLHPGPRRADQRGAGLSPGAAGLIVTMASPYCMPSSTSNQRRSDAHLAADLLDGRAAFRLPRGEGDLLVPASLALSGICPSLDSECPQKLRPARTTLQGQEQAGCWIQAVLAQQMPLLGMDPSRDQLEKQEKLLNQYNYFKR